MARHMDAAELVGQQIVSGVLLPGDVLPSGKDLGQGVELSRPAMREAIKVLSGKGLVQSVPGKGTIVRPRVDWNLFDPDVLRWYQGNEPSAAFIRDLYQLRRAIETEAGAMAALRASPADIVKIEAALQTMATVDTVSPASIKADLSFHQAILVASGNNFLVALAPIIETTLSVVFLLQRKACPIPAHFVHDHQAILNAIKHGDPAEVRTATLALLERAERAAMESLKDTSAALNAAE